MGTKSQFDLHIKKYAKKDKYGKYGIATSAILNSDPKIISKLIENGALGASVSGNGPSIAAIAKNNVLPDIKNVFSSLEGITTVSQINNKKAEVHEL